MNRHQFEKALEKLRRAPAKEKVLLLILAGHTDAEIALETGTKEGTVRKQISNLYKDFDIKGDFEGDRRSRREALLEKVERFKPELLSKKLGNFSSAAELNNVKTPLEMEILGDDMSSKRKVGSPWWEAILAQMTNKIENPYPYSSQIQSILAATRVTRENPYPYSSQIQSILAAIKTRKIDNPWLGR